jgi:cobalamin biosynthetic protein CobC
MSAKTGGVYFNTTNEHVLNTPLFAYFQHPRAKYIHQQLAQQGVLTRLFEDQPALRFGLPANKQEWDKFALALDTIKL